MPHAGCRYVAESRHECPFWGGSMLKTSSNRPAAASASRDLPKKSVCAPSPRLVFDAESGTLSPMGAANDRERSYTNSFAAAVNSVAFEETSHNAFDDDEVLASALGAEPWTNRTLVRDAFDHPAIGKVIAGRYLIERLIGVGGTADVFEAYHELLGRRVAVKIISPCLDVCGEVALRLKREVIAVASLESDHVVEIFDVGEDRVLGVYIVMELLRGEDLRRMLMRRGPLDPLVACGIALQACLALEKAHAAFIVHRDLKPSNIFLEEGDDGSLCAKLVDFGVAKVLRDANGASHGGINRTGTVVGTPQYMAPELARNESVDHRADIYSLGAVLYECLTGRPLVEARSTYEDTVREVASVVRVALDTDATFAPSDLVALLSDMIAPDADARVGQASAVRKRIVAIYPHLGMPLISLSPFALSSRHSRVAETESRIEPRDLGRAFPSTQTSQVNTVARIRRALPIAFAALLVANLVFLFANVRVTSRASVFSDFGGYEAIAPTVAHSGYGVGGVPEALPSATEVSAPPPAREADAGAAGDGKLRER
jgi:serine/threonine protein kinase